MSKRSKISGTHTSLRLAPDVAERIAYTTDVTGWSVAKSVAHVLRIGFAASKGDTANVRELVATLDGAIVLRKVELDNARRLAEVRKSLKGLTAPGEPLRGSPARTSAAKLVKAGRAKRRPAGALPAVPDAKPGSAA